MRKNTSDLDIQRMTFEEIAEFHNLNLDDIQVVGDNNSVILVYDPVSKSFNYIQLDGLSDNTITMSTAMLTDDIMATESWVKNKDFKAGMTFQEVMEQLLTPKAVGAATLSVGPAIFKAFKSVSMSATVNYNPGSDGAILGATGSFNGNQITFTVSGNTATSDFNTGPVSVINGQHDSVAVIKVDLQIEDKINGGTRVIHMDKSVTAVTEVVHGTHTNGNELEIEALAQAGLSGSLSATLQAMPARKGTTVYVTPIPSSAPIHYWFASTRELTRWEQKDFTINHGDVVDTYDVFDTTLNGIAYKLYIFKTKTAFDAVTLIFK